MSARERLHHLVDKLEDDRIPTALQLLESLEDPFLQRLLQVETDEQGLTEKELAEVQAAEREADAGETVPWTEVRERLG